MKKTNKNKLFLSSGLSFRSKVHKGNYGAYQTKLNQKQTPNNSYIINSHLTSLNNLNPSIKKKAPNVNPTAANSICINVKAEVNRPNTNEPIDNFDMSKQYLASSSFWRLVIPVTLQSNIVFVNRI